MSAKKSALRVLLAVLAAGVSACAGRRERVDPPGPEVRKVEIEGAREVDEDEIVEHMNMQPSSRIPFRPDHHYLPGLIPVDRRRIEDYYRSRGYYDARVERFDVDIEERRRKDRAYLHIEVEEGEPTRVRAVVFDWPSGAPQGPNAPNKSEIEALSELAPGKVFGIARLNESVAKIRRRLRDRGFAHASVEEHAVVDPRARVADVAFRIVPGAFVRIGEIEIVGEVQVPEYMIRNEVEFAQGKPFSPELLLRLEKTVHAMNVFSSVRVEEGENTGAGTMDLVLHVHETKLQSIKVGPGIAIDPVRWDQHASVRYRHESVFGHLTRFELRAKAGYAELPALYDPQEHGPIAELEPSLRKKGLLEKKLVWTGKPRFELGIWEGYQFWSIGNRVGVSRFFTRFLEVELAHALRYVDLFDVSPALSQNQTVLGLDYRDPYFLSFVEARAFVHLTDQLLQPNHGVVFGVTWDLASRFLASQFEYHKVTPEVRAYWRPHERLQLAARTRVGFFFPYGPRAGTPIDERYYLGGASTVRGFGLRRLAPAVIDCSGDDCKRIPIGGQTMVLGNVEARVRTVADWWIATFLDGGDVRPDVADIRPAAWNYSVGAGVRYDSPIGMFRLDVGFRLVDDPRFRDLPIWALHFGLGEAF